MTFVRSSLCSFFIFIFFFLLTPLTFAEVIRDFAVEYSILPDSSVVVTETIRYDFESESRRGIFRTIENTHPQSASVWYKRRYIDIDIQSVSKNDSPEPYEVTSTGDSTTVRIGDEDVYITGPHTYSITYILRGALSSGYSGAEFYWNVSGNEWEVPIERIQARVQSDSVILQSLRDCYVGIAGATTKCAIDVIHENEIVFSADSLSAFEGLTIAQSIDQSSLSAVEKIETTQWWIGIVPAFFVVLIGFGWWLYRTLTVHRPPHPIVTQYEPYPGVLPMYTGVLQDGRLDPHDITAGIVYLASQGFIKIKRTNRKVLFLFTTNDYEVTLLKSGADAPTHFHTMILSLLFPDNEVKSTVALSEIKKDLAHQKKNRSTLMLLDKAVKEDLIERGFYEHFFTSKKTIRALILAVLLIILLILLGLGFLTMVVVSLYIGLIVALYRRRTALGYEALFHIKGFALYLSMTDATRFDFHNAPEKSPELFMEYLPYAIALGVEEKWSNVFKDITIPQPKWFEGGSMQTFSATALASDIGSFSSSLSTSSGTSGSSGGGSSGGGGGGGGGGSW